MGRLAFRERLGVPREHVGGHVRQHDALRADEAQPVAQRQKVEVIRTFRS